MPLVGLINPLATPQDLSAWSFAHARDHDLIDAALVSLGFRVSPTPLDPMPSLTDFDGIRTWLQRHYLRHLQMNEALRLSGSDLTQFDLSDSTYLLAFASANYSEHTDVRTAVAALGGTIGG